VIFFLSFVYEVARGGLDWGPMARTRRLDTGLVSPERTAQTTVRRVGLEGRGEEAA
jgi:NADH-quinone oxidoreductase subunit A